VSFIRIVGTTKLLKNAYIFKTDYKNCVDTYRCLVKIRFGTLL